MAYGLHWEWRGFGSISSRFAEVFSGLETIYPSNETTDRYLWFPGMQVNVKLRQGTENGLKFKYLEATEGDFEAWIENEKDFFPFPLGESGRETLLNFLTKSDLPEPEHPLPKSADYKSMKGWLENIGCRFITVQKTRESKVLHGNRGSVIVEWASISAPQPIVSIGLENQSDDENQNVEQLEGKKIVEEIYDQLSLQDEPLKPMNYLEAIEIWASNGKI